MQWTCHWFSSDLGRGGLSMFIAVAPAALESQLWAALAASKSNLVRVEMTPTDGTVSHVFNIGKLFQAYPSCTVSNKYHQISVLSFKQHTCHFCWRWCWCCCYCWRRWWCHWWCRWRWWLWFRLCQGIRHWWRQTLPGTHGGCFRRFGWQLRLGLQPYSKSQECKHRPNKDCS